MDTRLRGLSYPLQITEDGSLALSTDYDCIREQIVSILETRPTERVMRQDYGMPDYPFTQTNPYVIAEYLRIAIETYVPYLTRLEVVPIAQDLERGTLTIKIYYEVDNFAQVPIEFELANDRNSV